MHFKQVKTFIQKLTDWRHWPFYIFHFPLSFVWTWYYIRSRSLWFFTASNPTITFGGFEGEPKSEMYSQLPVCLCPKTVFVDPNRDLNEILKEVTRQNIHYPFIVKPDIGMKGILIRKIGTFEQLLEYHKSMSVNYLIQQFIDHPLEVSVFYCRMPYNTKGMITALIQKNLPEIEGDGIADVRKLILHKYKSKEWLPAIEKQLGTAMYEVLEKGKKLYLSPIANVYNGAEFTDCPQEINEDLINLFDKISSQNNFYYGRYDIKCNTIDQLKKGDFIILEFNGAGSVPNHATTKEYTLFAAYKEILKHWQILYKISRYNHKNGLPYWGFLKGLRYFKNSNNYFKRLKKLDKVLILAK